MAPAIRNIYVGPPVSSDHLPLIVETNLRRDSTASTIAKKINYDKLAASLIINPTIDSLADEASKTRHLFETGQEVPNICDKIDTLTTKLTAEITSAINTATTTKTIKTSIKNFPIQEDTKEAIKARRNLVKKIKHCNNPALGEEFKKNLKLYRNLSRRLLKRDEFLYKRKKIEKIASSNDSGVKWKNLNNIMNRDKKNNTPLVNLNLPDGSKTTNTEEIVEEHARRLAETHRLPEEAETSRAAQLRAGFLKDNKSSIEPLQRGLKEQGDDEIAEYLTIKSLTEEIKGLKSKGAPGDDYITNKIIKALPLKVVKILNEIFNLAVFVGYFPNKWKVAKIKMLPKKGRDAESSANYRPISLLSCLGKLFEKLLRRILEDSANKRNIIPPVHSGFRKGRSGQENIVRLSEAGKYSLKYNKHFLVAMLDLDKAFDRLDHNAVLVKLLRYQLPTKVVRIVASFLHSRKLFVQENNIQSSAVDMTCGSPQGAILSPLLFILFTSDLPVSNEDNEGAAIYADDLTIWCTGTSFADAFLTLQHRLNKIDDWCKTWNMNVAPSKSSALYITNKRSATRSKSLHNFMLDNSAIPWVETSVFLGATVDDKLSWRPQVDKLIKDSKKKVSAIRRLAKICPSGSSDIVTDVFHSLVTSSFAYITPALMGMQNSLWAEIDKFHAGALKTIYGLPMGTNNERVLTQFAREKLSVKLIKAGIKRIGNIVRGVGLVRELIMKNKGGYSLQRHRSPIQHCLQHIGLTQNECPLCIIVPGHCIEN